MAMNAKVLNGVCVGVGVLLGALFFGAPPKGSGTQAASASVAESRVEQAVETRDTVRATAADLVTLYDQNEVKADEMLRGRLLLVSGEVAAIDKDFMGDVVVRFVSHKSLLGVSAKLSKSEHSKAGQLQVGQRVAVLCESSSRIVGVPVVVGCLLKPAS